MSVRTGRILFQSLLLAVFAYAAWVALSFPFRARVFPLTVGVAGGLLTLVAIVRDLIGGDPSESQEGEESAPGLPTTGVAAAAAHTAASEAQQSSMSAAPDIGGGAGGGTVGGTEPGSGTLLRYLLWVFGFYGVIGLAGMIAGSGVFVAAFLHREAGARIRSALLAGVLTSVALWSIGQALRLEWVPPLFGM